MSKTLVASSMKRRVASSATSFGSTDGWAAKSKSARVNGEGSDANRARLAWRRSSVAATSTAKSRSRNAEWLSLALPAWSSSPGSASAAAAIRRNARCARSF
jgi:hypothetical protein